MAEERKVSPLVIAGIGAGVATAAAVGIYALARAAPPTPPPGRANLYGKVTDKITGQPILGVLISLNGMEAYTNAAGNYAFPDLEPGGYVLEFSKEGYETLVR